MHESKTQAFLARKLKDTGVNGESLSRRSCNLGITKLEANLHRFITSDLAYPLWYFERVSLSEWLPFGSLPKTFNRKSACSFMEKELTEGFQL